jgi:phosphoribosylaminoimidazole-succinocarboxamide synthase
MINLKGISSMKAAVSQTDFKNLNLIKRGKVRDIYDLGENLLMVATDRISAFDVVMPDPIPDKGIILTQISLYWFEIMEPIIGNHVLAADVKEYPAVCRPYAETLQGRSMLVKKTEPLPIECVVRGYLSGSGYTSYQESMTVCGIQLPQGLRESDKRIGSDLASKVKDLSLAIYKKGAEMAAEKRIIIADTKFEFGLIGDELILIDEVLTPDSSRFWPKDSYQPGGPQQSFDKQYVRDHLIAINWNKRPPAPSLPEDIIRNTRKKYLEALSQLTGDSHGLQA